MQETIVMNRVATGQ